MFPFPICQGVAFLILSIATIPPSGQSVCGILQGDTQQGSRYVEATAALQGGAGGLQVGGVELGPRLGVRRRFYPEPMMVFSMAEGRPIRAALVC